MLLGLTRRAESRARVTIVSSELGTIADLAATPGDTESVLTWTPAANATSHLPQYKEATSGTWLDFGSALNGSAATVTITGLTNGTLYDTQVVAGDGTSTTDSNTAQVTPAAEVTPDYEELWEFANLTALRASPYYSDSGGTDATLGFYSSQTTPWASGDGYFIRRPSENTGSVQTVGWNWDNPASGNHIWWEMYMRFDTNWLLGNVTGQTTDDKTIFFLRSAGTNRWELKFVNGQVRCYAEGGTSLYAHINIPGGISAQCDGDWHRVRVELFRSTSTPIYKMWWDDTQLADLDSSDFTPADSDAFTWFGIGRNFSPITDSWMDFGRMRVWTSDPGW